MGKFGGDRKADKSNDEEDMDEDEASLEEKDGALANNFSLSDDEMKEADEGTESVEGLKKSLRKRRIRKD
ncbi:hypothetical protein GDO86_000520 [Hymenochirus boettgeri]|uniref:Uncharacterized protein n=1 Tax=Hymenochirus boettgeri TaxID=247094 RepID=A0A8T2KCB5_9PIPI|nr:hypothetical protein GDO86_000520 [Hymenochirus boettgeri]